MVMSNLSNVEIQILGNLDLPKSIPYVQAAVNASGGRLYWFTVSGNNVTLSGNQDEDWGWVDSYGVPWWQAAAYTQPLGGLVRTYHRPLDHCSHSRSKHQTRLLYLLGKPPARLEHLGQQLCRTVVEAPQAHRLEPRHHGQQQPHLRQQD